MPNPTSSSFSVLTVGRVACPGVSVLMLFGPILVAAAAMGAPVPRIMSTPTVEIAPGVQYPIVQLGGSSQ